MTIRAIALSVSALAGAAQCEPPASGPAPAAVAVATADRATPPAAAAPVEVPPPPPLAGQEGTDVQGRCTQFEALLVEQAPATGWDVARMSRYMWRESGCWPEVRSPSRDTGLLQINDVGHGYLREALGEDVSRWTLVDPVQNVRAAAALCTYWVEAGSSCYRPWS